MRAFTRYNTASTAGLPAKADITEALEAGSGVLAQALRDQVVPALRRLTSRTSPPLPFPSSIPGHLCPRFGLEGPHRGDGQPGALQLRTGPGKGLEAPCEILISDDAIIPWASPSGRSRSHPGQPGVAGNRGRGCLSGGVDSCAEASLFPYLRFTNRPTRGRSSWPGRTLLMTDPARTSALQSLPRPSENPSQGNA